MKNQIKIFMRKNKYCDFLVYLAYRISGLFYSFLFLVCRIFHVKKNKIVCCNMKGNGYGDNPKYIADEILSQDMDYEIVWLTKGERDVNMPEKVKSVPYNPFSIAYHLSTSKIWIDNNLKAFGTLKRKGQCYIQTWHGNYGIKKMGYDINDGEALMEVRPYDFNSKLEDIILSNSKMTSSIYKRAFHYYGEIMECGNPRNDIFFQLKDSYKEKVYSFYSINKSKKLILYAPTFRNNYGTDNMHIDFNIIMKVCHEKFGGDWSVLVRLHPNNVSDADKFITYSEEIINASKYSAMSELLFVCDILITDYSSCMFDFATKKGPCFIYATDLAKYKDERDFYFDIKSLPFPVSENMEELRQNIIKFNDSAYSSKLQKLFDQVGLCDNGTASKKVVEYIKGLS